MGSPQKAELLYPRVLVFFKEKHKIAIVWGRNWLWKNCFMNLRIILAQGPCWSSLYHSNFNICVAEASIKHTVLMLMYQKKGSDYCTLISSSCVSWVSQTRWASVSFLVQLKDELPGRPTEITWRRVRIKWCLDLIDLGWAWVGRASETPLGN